MNIEDRIIKNANELYQEMESQSRYRSWEHCYAAFYRVIKGEKADVGYLSLQLAFYLASWGMYRGSSFLLSCDYKVHIPMVEEILKYQDLFSLSCEDYLSNQEKQKRLNELSKKIQNLYTETRNSLASKEIKQPDSKILVTKVLLGTLGCVPAYDRYFCGAVKHTGVTTANYNLNSMSKLAKFYQQHSAKFETTRATFKFQDNDLIYPQMKFLDMAFWQMGKNL